MLPVQNYPLENFKGLSGKGNLEKSNESVFCFIMGEEERSLVLFWQKSGDGRGENICASDDSPDSRVKALDGAACQGAAC